MWQCPLVSENKIEIKVEVNAIKRNSAPTPQTHIGRNRKLMFYTLPAYEDLRGKKNKGMTDRN
jgi:hypothetical protein